jgi:thiol:disulfide interchange protein DsbA
MKVLLRCCLLLGLLLPLSPWADAPAPAFVEGKDYLRLEHPVPQAKPERVKVEEFFCYCCPHCYHADPALQAWKAKKAGYVDFVRVANGLGRPDGAALSVAFYVAETLGIGEKIHEPLFKAVQEDHLDVTDLGAMRRFFIDVGGVTPLEYDQAESSLRTTLGLRQADALARSYRVYSVPTVVIGGQYSTTVVMTGSNERFIEAINFLADKVHQESH